jgi:hypothetical protein
MSGWVLFSDDNLNLLKRHARCNAQLPVSFSTDASDSLIDETVFLAKCDLERDQYAGQVDIALLTSVS